MLIVLDVNIIPSVFNESNNRHRDFKPILDYLEKGKCKLLRGGSKYGTELSRLKRYLKIIKLFEDKGVVKKIDDVKVDKEMKNVKQRALKEGINSKDFDDPHIIALIIVGKGRIIATNEKAACLYFKNRLLYGSYSPIPKIYKRYEHRNLLD